MIIYKLTFIHVSISSLRRDVIHDRMYDEQQLEETRSAHSIGIVENPLYAEEDGGFSGIDKEVIFKSNKALVLCWW